MKTVRLTAASALDRSAGPLPDLERIDASVGAIATDPDYPLVPGAADPAAPADRTRLRAPRRLRLDGRPVVAGKRFWKSFFRSSGVDDGVFRLFGADEVLGRIAERDSRRMLRFTVERNPGGTDRLLGVTQRSAATLEPRTVLALLEAHGAERITYADGVVTSRHVPADGPGKFRIGPDAFENRFSLALPVDGFGDPSVFVTLLRLVCSNGAMATQRAFRGAIKLGDDPWHTLDRALGSYANADGFAAVRRRFERAQRSWASVEEVGTLERVLHSISWGAGEAAGRRRADFEAMVGDLPGLYGVASMAAISPKRRRLLPTRVRVYDLINFSTEVASHHAAQPAAMKLHAWASTLIADEFDLENSADQVAEFEALHLSPAPVAAPQAPARGRRAR